MPNKTPIISQKVSYPTLKCPHIIVWKRDPIMGLPPSAPRCKLHVKFAMMVNKAHIHTLNPPLNLSCSEIPLLFVMKVACLLA
jgi:hypothetical protein